MRPSFLMFQPIAWVHDSSQRKYAYPPSRTMRLRGLMLIWRPEKGKRGKEGDRVEGKEKGNGTRGNGGGEGRGKRNSRYKMKVILFILRCNNDVMNKGHFITCIIQYLIQTLSTFPIQTQDCSR